MLVLAGGILAQDPLVRSQSVTMKGFKVDLTKCEKSGTKSITCSFVVTNTLADRSLHVYSYQNYSTYFVDASGMQIGGTRAQIGTSSGGEAKTETVTDVPVKAAIEFGVGDPKATSLAKLSLGFWVDNEYFRAEFRKVPLEGS